MGGRAKGRPGAAPARRLARASSDDKKVFLSFGAPWCGWCHRLENFLARPEIAAILDRDFVVLKIDVDRMTRGKDVMKRFRPDDTGGIPWFAFLDSKGEKLATSDILNGQNVGYPFEPKEIDAFMSTLEGQVRRIEPGQLARLRSSLEAAAQEIKAEQDRRRAEAAAKQEKMSEGPSDQSRRDGPWVTRRRPARSASRGGFLSRMEESRLASLPSSSGLA